MEHSEKEELVKGFMFMLNGEKFVRMAMLRTLIESDGKFNKEAFIAYLAKAQQSISETPELRDSVNLEPIETLLEIFSGNTPKWPSWFRGVIQGGKTKSPK